VCVYVCVFVLVTCCATTDAATLLHYEGIPWWTWVCVLVTLCASSAYTVVLTCVCVLVTRCASSAYTVMWTCVCVLGTRCASSAYTVMWTCVCVLVTRCASSAYTVMWTCVCVLVTRCASKCIYCNVDVHVCSGYSLCYGRELLRACCCKHMPRPALEDVHAVVDMCVSMVSCCALLSVIGTFQSLFVFASFAASKRYERARGATLLEALEALEPIPRLSQPLAQPPLLPQQLQQLQQQKEQLQQAQQQRERKEGQGQQGEGKGASAASTGASEGGYAGLVMPIQVRVMSALVIEEVDMWLTCDASTGESDVSLGDRRSGHAAHL